MNTTDIVQILKRSGLFRGLDPTQCAKLAELAVIERFTPNQRIFSAGDECPGVYLVVHGMVQVFQVAQSGKVHVLHFAEPRQTFAEVAAIGGFACPGSAEALVETTCIRLPYGPFRALLDADHALCRQMLSGMSLWVRQLVGLLEDLVLRDASGRLARYLLDARRELSDVAVHLPMKRKDLALHLNLTGETLSRTFRRLEDTGLIEQAEDSFVRLLDANGLAAVASGAAPSEVN